MTDPWTTTSATSTPANPVPPVVFWYKLTMGLGAAMYLACTAFGVFFLAAPDLIADLEMEANESRAIGAVAAAFSAPLAAAYVLPLFLAPSKGAWTYGIILIAILLTSCCNWPFCIPLLIYWLRDDNRAYFGHQATEAAPRSQRA